MTLTTYAGLSTGVYRRLNRTAVTADYNDALELVEAEINRRLALAPVRPMHTRATATLDAEYYVAPTGIIDVDSFAIDNEPILATTAQNIQAMFDGDDSEGQPRFYAQVGADFRLYPAPDASYTGALTYWSKVAGLSSVATTNWLSLAHPDVYFHGLLAHLAQEYFDDKMAEMQAPLFDMAVQKVLDAYPRRPDRAPRTDRDLMFGRTGFSILTG
ncbi:MAG: hypothetical protein V4696_13435 [Pseudomonadota bacterium]